MYQKIITLVTQRNFDYEISYNEVVTITPRNYKFSFREVGNISIGVL
ncbi:linear amide C-N hydrolase [Enterococcus faecalis]